jgi:hypothetical protein
MFSGDKPDQMKELCQAENALRVVAGLAAGDHVSLNVASGGVDSVDTVVAKPRSAIENTVDVLSTAVKAWSVDKRLYPLEREIPRRSFSVSASLVQCEDHLVGDVALMYAIAATGEPLTARTS